MTTNHITDPSAPARIFTGCNVFGEPMFTAKPSPTRTEYVRADVAKAEALDLARRAMRLLAWNFALEESDNRGNEGVDEEIERELGRALDGLDRRAA